MSDPRVKELVLDPRGTRLVWLAEEADRSRFLLFRDAELGREPLDPAVLDELVGRLRELADTLSPAQPAEAAA